MRYVNLILIVLTKFYKPKFLLVDSLIQPKLLFYWICQCLSVANAELTHVDFYTCIGNAIANNL